MNKQYKPDHAYFFRNGGIEKDTIPISWRTERRGRLGFNLIVKNEEKVLAKCLDSILPVANEIVITDTGSTDKTVDIALRYTDKVLFHEWRDSFAEARNWSLQFSTTDWIGQIDADETIISSVYELEDIVNNDNENQALFCPLLSELPDGRASKHYLPKFFRRGTAHFESIVHNQLIHGSPCRNTEVTFWHTGYNLDGDTMKRKRQRTRALLEKQLEENPRDAFAAMNLARTELTDGNYDKSLHIAEKALALTDMTPACRQMLLYNVAACQINKAEYDEAIKTCWEALAKNPDNIDMVFLLGWCHVLTDQYEKAIIYLERYFKLRHDQSQNGFNLLILDFWDALPQAHNFLGLSFHSLSHFDKAANEHTKALQHTPYNPDIWKNLALDYQRGGKHDRIESVVMAALERGVVDKQMWLELANFQRNR